MVQIVKSPNGLPVKFALRRCRVYSDFPKGGSLEGKFDVGKFFRQSLRTFHCLSHFGLQNRRRCGLEMPMGLSGGTVGSCSSLTVLNPDFGGWRTKSAKIFFWKLSKIASQKKVCYFADFGFLGILGPPGNHTSWWIRDLWSKGISLILAYF